MIRITNNKSNRNKSDDKLKKGKFNELINRSEFNVTESKAAVTATISSIKYNPNPDRYMVQ